jgi:mannosyl-3-phosphoglycerate phosphatase
MTVDPPIIVVTDLDGTLLDHNSYRFDAARTALDYLQQLNIPLILNSSKTAAEMMCIRKELGNHDPFIVENGAGIYLPTVNEASFEIISFGKKRALILAVLNELRERFKLPFIGFNDMSVDELISHTGLTRQQAVIAKQRDFTEPMQWQGDNTQWDEFCTEIERLELTVVKGGRFNTVSTDVNKGQAMLWLRMHYQQEWSQSPIIIALGDSDNDRQMLTFSDYPVLIRSPAHELPEININNLHVSNEFGPEGWNNSILFLLKQFNLINKK